MCLCRSVFVTGRFEAIPLGPASIASKMSLDHALKPKEGFKGSASEGLSLYQVIRSYLQHFRLFSHGDPEVVLATQSYISPGCMLGGA